MHDVDQWNAQLWGTSGLIFMADFGAPKSRRARFSYLGHRVRGSVAHKNKSGSRQLENVSLSSKVSKIKGCLNTQQRIQSLSKHERKARLFNFDEDDVMLKGGEGGPIPATKASRKNILDTLKDDFEESGLILSDDEEEAKQLNPLLTSALQFGAGGADKNRAHTRRERLQEMMLKNKTRKAKHAHNVYEQSILLEETDEKVGAVLKDLDFKPSRSSVDYKDRAAEEALDAELADKRTAEERARDNAFDNLMQQLSHKPKIRAGERKLTLAEHTQQAKRQRQQQDARMLEDIQRGQSLAPPSAVDPEDSVDSTEDESSEESLTEESSVGESAAEDSVESDSS